MMRLLDANVFIQAKNTYMQFSVVPGFWEWIVASSKSGHVGSVARVRKELLKGEDELSDWVKRLPSGFFKTPDADTFLQMRRLSQWAVNHNQYTEVAAQEFLDSADYELAAYGAAHDCIVVTHEKSHLNRKSKIMLPDACSFVKVIPEDPFEWIRNEAPRLGFGNS